MVDNEASVCVSQEPLRVTSGYFRTAQIRVIIIGLAVLGTFVLSRGQSPDTTGKPIGSIWGYVRDVHGKPLPNASISLRPAIGQQPDPTALLQHTQTDSNGLYRFPTLQAGVYAVYAQAGGYSESKAEPVNLSGTEAKQLDLTLGPSAASTAKPTLPASEKQNAAVPEFFDEPQFTVAGVTQATNAGGHGSDTALRTTEALAKATLTLGKDSSDRPTAATSAQTAASLRHAMTRTPQDASVHHQLADLEERAGNPLEAVREYQRAAELDPSEPNLFDWGTELLAHRALEPASEVFIKGSHLFPKSARMLVALGVTWYARGSYERGSQCLENASDLAPSDPAPYLFMGKIVSVETTPSQGAVDRLARFARQQPDNALANYYYAVALLKQSASAGDTHGDQDATRSARVESLLEKTLQLDPSFGAAYLQLGVLASRRSDFAKAIPLYRQAIEKSAEDDGTQAEAHYRLSQAYLRAGDKTAAKQELELRDVIDRKIKQDTAREYREIQEFVISLQARPAASAEPRD